MIVNTQEQVDIVNELDQVEGQISKQLAHQQGQLHRTVIAEIIASNGDWTLVKQADDKQDSGQFVSPVGGHVSAGESEDFALQREAEEEYGLSGKIDFKLIGKAIFNREIKGKIENHFFILYEIYSDQKPILNHESVGYEQFSKAKLAQELKTNPNKFGEAFHFIVKKFYPELII